MGWMGMGGGGWGWMGNTSYGITRVLEGGQLLEKAAANVSIIRGHLSAARAEVGPTHSSSHSYIHTRMHSEILEHQIYITEVGDK